MKLCYFIIHSPNHHTSGFVLPPLRRMDALTQRLLKSSYMRCIFNLLNIIMASSHQTAQILKSLKLVCNEFLPEVAKIGKDDKGHIQKYVSEKNCSLTNHILVAKLFPVYQFCKQWTLGSQQNTSHLLWPLPSTLTWPWYDIVWVFMMYCRCGSALCYQTYCTGPKCTSDPATTTEVKNRASNQVRLYGGLADFNATVVVVVTWYFSSWYLCSYNNEISSNPSVSCHNLVFYQLSLNKV